MKHFIKIIILFILATEVTFAQIKEQQAAPLFSAKGDNKEVIIQYRFPKNSGTDKVNVILYRGNGKNENVKAIHQLNNLPVSSEYYHIDSTLPGQGSYQYTIEIISNNITIIRESKLVYAYPAGLAPFIKSFTASAKKQSNQVTLSWDISNAFLAGNATLLRSRKRETGFNRIAILKNTDKVFTDTVNDANEPFFYQLQFPDLSKSTIISSITIFALADFVIKPQPPQNVRGILKENKPEIFWESSDQLSRGYYVYKKKAKETKFMQASGIIIKNTAGQFSWVDSNNLLKPGLTYQYYVAGESNSYTKSEPSDTVMLSIANDDLNLAPPYDLRFIRNGDSLNVVWTKTDEESSAYITEYVVYQKKISERDFKIIGTANANGKRNYITIPMPEGESSFMVKSKSGDKESVPTEPVTWIDKTEKSFGPRFIKGEIIDNVLNITWLNMEDKNIREYRLYKWQGRNFKVIETIDKNTNTIQVKNYTSGEKNQYMLTAVNTKGMENKGTKPITVY